MAVSPDLSPIEHVWDEMGRQLRQGPNQPLTLADLGQMLIQTWNNIPQAFFNRLVSSMSRRCQAYINANGGHTRHDIKFVNFLLTPHLVEGVS